MRMSGPMEPNKPASLHEAHHSASTQPQRSHSGDTAGAAQSVADADADAHAAVAPDLLRLPAGPLERIVSLADAKTRRALRATSPALRRLVCGAARELTLGDRDHEPGDARVAAVARHVTMRAPLWHRARSLVAQECEAEGLLDLLQAAARCGQGTILVFGLAHARQAGLPGGCATRFRRPLCYCITRLCTLYQHAPSRPPPGTGLCSSASN